MKKVLLLSAILISAFSFSQSRYSQGNKSYENGKLKEFRITQNGIEKTLKFDYNTNGLRTNSEIFNASGSKLFEATKSYTDSKDLNQTWYNAAGNIADRLVYKYDSNNRLNQIYNYFGDSNDYFITNYDYSGNRIISANSYFMIGGKKYDLSQIDDIIAQF
ncbi:hypothetical protein UJ101_00873 [Flavobacteriaceae bacterium UJ101]|nr:hypothetical protein UJ101_00873 [Flavobacteriaceae bacterium UJ101]